MPVLASIVLTGQRVRLLPLESVHCAALAAVSAIPQVSAHLPGALPLSVEQMADYVQEALNSQLQGIRLPFVVEFDGQIVGTTSFWHPDYAACGVEIGSTWLHPGCWGTGVNSEAKGLLLSHAFTDLGCEYVVFRTDVLYVRSQRAIEKLGAVRDRVVERDMRRADGFWRDSVYCRLSKLTWSDARDSDELAV